MSGPAAPAARLHQLHRLHRLRTGLGLLQRPAAGSSTASSPILLEVFGRRTLRLGAYWRIANLVHLAWLRGVGEATLDGNLYLSCPAAHRLGLPQHAPIAAAWPGYGVWGGHLWTETCICRARLHDKYGSHSMLLENKQKQHICLFKKISKHIK